MVEVEEVNGWRLLGTGQVLLRRAVIKPATHEIICQRLVSRHELIVAGFAYFADYVGRLRGITSKQP